MDRRYLVAGLFFIAAVIVAVVLVYPKFQVIQISSRLVAEKQNEFEGQMVLVQEISRLRSQQKQMTEEIAHMTDLLPMMTKKSVSDLFVELESIAAESGLLLDTVSFTEAKGQVQKGKETVIPATIYKTIAAHMKMKGEYRDFKNFVRTIETNKHLMDITVAAIAATPAAEEEESGKPGTEVVKIPPTYTVTIYAYYQ